MSRIQTHVRKHPCRINLKWWEQNVTFVFTPAYLEEQCSLNQLVGVKQLLSFTTFILTFM